MERRRSLIHSSMALILSGTEIRKEHHNLSIDRQILPPSSDDSKRSRLHTRPLYTKYIYIQYTCPLFAPKPGTRTVLCRPVDTMSYTVRPVSESRYIAGPCKPYSTSPVESREVIPSIGWPPQNQRCHASRLNFGLSQYAGNPESYTRYQEFIPRRPQYPVLSPSLPSLECQPY